MILLKIWLVLLLVSFYSWFLSIQDDQKEDQYKIFFDISKIVFLLSFTLSFIFGIGCIVHYIK